MMIGTIALALAAAAPAAATVHASNPQSIVAALQGAGYKATLDKDSEGDPMIRTKMSGWNVNIVFYDCTKNANCQSIQFITGIDIEGRMSLEKVNQWSKTKRWGRVFIDDEGDPFVEMDVLIGPDGMTEKNFAETAAVYDGALGGFATYLDKK